MVRLRTGLFLLVLATAIPLAACALLISTLLLDRQSENFASVAKDRNRAFMTAVDTEVNNSVTSLRAIASSRALAHDDLEMFHKDAVAALATQPNWLNLVLITPDGRYVVNATAPWGMRLAGRVPDGRSLAAVVKTMEPATGGVVDVGPFQNLSGIPVRVPVIRDGRLVYVLTAVVKPSSFEALILQQHLPEGWVTGLVDASGRFIARVPRQPIGSMASEPYLAHVLGLTLVRSLVEMHGGRVEASSRGAGTGALFTVHLPLSTPPAATDKQETEWLLLPEKGRVLVVDDNVDAADSLAAILRLRGFDVQACYSGETALAAARAAAPNVAFLDLNMPGVSGADVAHKLRADLGHRIKLVALTGMGQKADIDGTRAAGFDAHLTKPAAAEDVLRLASGGPTDNVVSFETGRRA